MTLAAVGLATAVWAGPARAVDDTVLCGALNEEGKCAGTYLPAGTDLQATSSKVTFKAPVSEVACEAEIAGDTEAEGGEPRLPVDVTKLAFSGCAIVGGGSCTINVVSAGETAGAFADEASPGDGDLLLHGSPSPTLSISSCGLLSGCTYYAAGSDERIGEGKSPLLPLEFEGGSPATLTASAASFVSSSGFFCGASTLSGVFTVQKPTGGWMFAAKRVKLCQKEEIANCKNWYLIGTAMAAGLLKETTATFKYKFEGAAKTISCATGSLTAKVGLPGDGFRAGTLEGLTFGCEKECSVALKNAPLEMVFMPDGNVGDGVLRLYKDKSGPRLSVGCTSAPKHSCEYESILIDGKFVGGRDPLWIVSSEFPMKSATSDEGCSAPLEISATFQFSQPTSSGVPLMFISKG
jgi:hypothetical protein